MYYPDRKEYITFLFSLLDEFAERKQSVISRGRPKVYSDAPLVVFYVAMTLQQINKIRGQHRWLYMHPIMLETLRLPFCPSQATLARRYKALTPLLGEFCEFIADSAVFNGLRNVDKTAHWSKSGYHGWVYGYGLHLTTTRHGFPIMFDVFPANVNERKVLDKKQHRILAKGIRCLIADAGYRDKRRAIAFAKKQVMLITPDISAEQAQAMLGPMDAMAVALFNEAKAAMKRKRLGKQRLNRHLIYSANSWRRPGSINLYLSAGWHRCLPFSDSV